MGRRGRNVHDGHTKGPSAWETTCCRRRESGKKHKHQISLHNVVIIIGDLIWIHICNNNKVVKRENRICKARKMNVRKRL